jgi:hypothetical protein
MFRVFLTSAVGRTPSVSAEYTVQFTSVNDNSFNVRIVGSGIDVTRTVAGSMPTSVILRITNESETNGPAITYATFESIAPVTPTDTNVTARAYNVSANVTKNSTMPTVMPETTVPATTAKTHSPGFEAILTAISMVAALF